MASIASFITIDQVRRKVVDTHHPIRWFSFETLRGTISVISTNPPPESVNLVSIFAIVVAARKFR